MSTPISNPSKLHALLIGIDCYLPNKLPDGSHYRNLSGCVRDIQHVRDFLISRLQVSAENIQILTASPSDSQTPIEPRQSWPTYENIVNAFRQITEAAAPGEQVYIHYSGHGGRCPALVPEIKTNGLDESLVPTDIGNSEERYLRDIEIALLLRSMIKKNLVVTLVLDSCHAGGATRGRGPNIGVRGLASIDYTKRPADSLVGSRAELVKAWREWAGAATRNLNQGSGWLPSPRGYVLLAACRPSESAYEYAFDGHESNGALTYWFLKSLRDTGPGLSYKQLHDRIVARVHSQFERQTPQLEGDGDRTVFGIDREQQINAALVMQVDMLRRRVLINAGQAHGVRRGSEFAIYDLQTKDFEPAQRIALAKTDEVAATGSWADYTTLGVKEIEPGAQAVLIDPVAVNLVRRVSFLSANDDRIKGDEAVAVTAWRQAMAGNGWVTVAGNGEASDYQVAINDHDEYEILDRTGHAIPNIAPAVNIKANEAARRIVQRLEHLSRYQAVKELDNYVPFSSLARKLKVEWAGFQDNYQPGERPEFRPLRDAPPIVASGCWLFLRIKNLSATVLNVAVLDLQPDWGISQVYPTLPEWFAPLDPNEEQLVPLCAELPAGYESGRDILKVFATVGAGNFHWFQLAALDLPRPALSPARSSSNGALNQMLRALVAERPPMRNVTPAAFPGDEWATAQVEVEVRRRIGGELS
jgi:hypothetical protein